jgi:long-chain acyl-CoA synthetase
VARDTLIDFFEDLARARGVFLVYDDGFMTRRYSYQEVGSAARSFATRLQRHGLGKGDKVVVFAENRPEWIVAFWGSLLAGVIVVPIDYRASPEFLVRVRRIVGARLVLTGDDVPAVSAAEEFETWRLADLEWVDAAPSPVPIGQDDVAEIIFTSGATAEPKGVVITHRNVLANIRPVEREIVKYRKWGRPFFPLRFLNLLPLSHMFGQAMATFVPPMLPGTVIFMRGYNPGAIVEQIEKSRVSVLVSVPKILDVLRDHVGRMAADKDRRGGPVARAVTVVPPTGHPLVRIARRWWHHRDVHRLFGWKFWAFVVGAAPLDPELEAFWGERGFAVIQGYGLTETAPIVTLNHPFGTRRGSVGKAIAGVELRIAPDGEILVRGDNVTKGYFSAETETAQAFEDGWFHTGDIGEIGEGGQLFIRGRKKEMIVTPEGLNVFPEDVERVLNQVEGVRDSAVVGVATGGEERVNAVVVLEPGAEIDAIVRAANAQLADHQRIRRALCWPGSELPRTEGTSKLKRAQVREWVQRGGPARAPSPRGGDPLAALVAKYAGRGDIGPETTVEELGLSSL